MLSLGLAIGSHGQQTPIRGGVPLHGGRRLRRRHRHQQRHRRSGPRRRRKPAPKPSQALEALRAPRGSANPRHATCPTSSKSRARFSATRSPPSTSRHAMRRKTHAPGGSIFAVGDTTLDLPPTLASVAVAIGKAAVAMARGLVERTARRTSRSRAFSSRRTMPSPNVPGLSRIGAGHPLPDEGSLAAARAILDLLAQRRRAHTDIFPAFRRRLGAGGIAARSRASRSTICASFTGCWSAAARPSTKSTPCASMSRRSRAGAWPRPRPPR